MKSLASLLANLLHDEGKRCSVPTERDTKTVMLRCRNEGDSFITITLPGFAKGFERSLALGQAVPGSFGPFRASKTGIPAYLQGFLYRIFDKDTGTLLDEPSVDCIRAVRQICLFGKKVLQPCTSARLKAAAESYLACDDSVKLSQEGRLWERFGLVADIVLQSLELDDVILDHIVPDHGPGATVERKLGNSKWKFETWHKRLEEAGITYQRFAQGFQSCDDAPPKLLEPEDEPPVRVIFVPKTLKTPRVIAIEPICMQFVQQGLWRYLKTKIEASSICGGHVNFRDQSVNRDLALLASRTGHMATLDMSEASDRVSMAHFQRAFASRPDLRHMMDACRSMRAKLPDGQVVSLRKFASMGSALCFPVEALVFFIGIIASRCSRKGTYPTRSAVAKMARSVYVYGDDIIVPADETLSISEDLEALGFKVNVSKTFGTGKFRESCGMDAYDGREVTPVYLRRPLPTDRGDASGIVSSVSTANQLYELGLYRTAAAIRKAVERLTGTLPVVPRDSPAVGWWHWHSAFAPPKRWNRALQRLETRCLVATTPKQEDPLDGSPAAAKCWRVIGNPEIPDRHLMESPRRHALALKRGWVLLG